MNARRQGMAQARVPAAVQATRRIEFRMPLTQTLRGHCPVPGSRVAANEKLGGPFRVRPLPHLLDTPLQAHNFEAGGLPSR